MELQKKVMENVQNERTKVQSEATAEDTLTERIRRQFQLPAAPEVSQYAPLTLAFIGDSVYELVVRTLLVSRQDRRVNDLNRDSSFLAKAQTQAAIAFAIVPLLTREEESVYRRGRNAKSFTMAKNATVCDYRHATGLEALCGYLYLSGQQERLLSLLHEGMLCAGVLSGDGRPLRAEFTAAKNKKNEEKSK